MPSFFPLNKKKGIKTEERETHARGLHEWRRLCSPAASFEWPPRRRPFFWRTRGCSKLKDLVVARPRCFILIGSKWIKDEPWKPLRIPILSRRRRTLIKRRRRRRRATTSKKGKEWRTWQKFARLFLLLLLPQPKKRCSRCNTIWNRWAIKFSATVRCRWSRSGRLGSIWITL